MSALRKPAFYSRFFSSFIRKKKDSRFSFEILDVSEEVEAALKGKKPIVALESTIITHGMRYPNNLDTALEVENIIRSKGVLPATIAVLNGRIKVGLSHDDLEILSKSQDECMKVSRRDFPYIIAHKLSGGTTVSGTMLIAHKVGIPIFVTGGVGGVHRDGENSLDISADLTELGRTPVAVIASGVKSILDIGRTLEYLIMLTGIYGVCGVCANIPNMENFISCLGLIFSCTNQIKDYLQLEHPETQGVAVATYGADKDFPAFYTRKSGHTVPYNLKSPKEIAEFVQGIFDLGLESGALVAVPIPEEYSFNGEEIEVAINEGIVECKKNNIKGKDVTPFLLERISQITKGESLRSNIALIKNNALIGAEASIELNLLRKERESNSGLSKEDFDLEPKKQNSFKIVVAGASNLDHVINLKESEIKPKAVFFACIDSRMIPTRFTETDVGDMFVVRNAGNLIPHSRNYPDEITTTEPAALELGCVINNVKHIIVCGHSDCKAMNLLYALRDENYSSQENRRISPLKAWMCAHASTSLDKFKILTEEGFHKPLLFEAETPQRQFVAYIDPDNKFALEDKLSQVNTLQQMQNIASYGFLKRRLRENDLHIHAIWFDIYTGDIYYFSRCSKQFMEVNEETIPVLLEEMDGRLLAGKVTQSGGGVARNLADALAKLGMDPFLISGIGSDEYGRSITESTLSHVDRSGLIRFDDSTTGTCFVVCDPSGECRILFGDMDVNDRLSPELFRRHEEVISESCLLVMDGNLPTETINYLSDLCKSCRVPVWFEPTDIVKAAKAFNGKNKNLPNFVSPNYYELQEILRSVKPSSAFDSPPPASAEFFDGCVDQSKILAELVDNVILTLGKRGVIVCRRGGKEDSFFDVDAAGMVKYRRNTGEVTCRVYGPEKVLEDDDVLNVSGAGDCFASGFIAQMLKGKDEESCIRFGFQCSLASLRSLTTVPKFF